MREVPYRPSTTPVNYQNGGDAVNGRGARHLNRRKALEQAVDVATGRPFVPSRRDLADIFGVSMKSLSEAVKARAATRKANIASEEADYVDLPRKQVCELSALMRAWYEASTEERESFLRDEIVRRVIR